MSTNPARIAEAMYDDIWLPDETIAVRKHAQESAKEKLFKSLCAGDIVGAFATPAPT